MPMTGSKRKTVAAIALSNRDYPSFEAKLAEAAKWVELAAAQGAELAVLPEGLNIYAGDGPGNPQALRVPDVALDDWQRQTAVLFEVAVRCGIAVTIPVYKREAGRIVNCFHVVSKAGEVLGGYEKMRPTLSELDGSGVATGGAEQPLIEWEGLKIGGGICFDTNFPEVFASQARRGAQLFLVPSLWPGGSYLNHYALHHLTPIVLAYPAWSRIIDITGQEIAAGGYRSETLRFGFGAPVVIATLNFNRVVLHADYNAAQMVDVQRHYGRRVRVDFDQQNARFIVESCDEALDIEEVIDRFGFIPIEQYLASCRERFA